ncbi:MAG: hypothetical protein JWO62_3124 [Acidimicrobiaceae bacterium]|nr:hypothetical protein [Acidimicrobiaceae bacterium]
MPALPDLRTAVVIPAGPRDDIADTVDSVLVNIAHPRHIVLVDDTHGQRPELEELRRVRDITVLDAPRGAPGGFGGLWVKIATGYRHLAEHFAPQLVLRLDTDALVLAPGFEQEALDLFARDDRIGLLGSYRIDALGGRRDFTPAARILAHETGPLGLRSPALRRQLRSLTALANAHGYEAGEHCLGGAYVHSGAALRALNARGWLDQPLLARSRAGEDHLMGLLTRAAGFSIHDFGGPDDPFALRWRGMPYSPELLHEKGKLVTHSVRGQGSTDEARIRSYFAALRRSSGNADADR